MKESAEELETKLKNKKEIQKIRGIFDELECPVCGGTGIEANIQVHPNEAWSYGSATAKCRHCGMFSHEEQIDGYRAYHWKFDGSSELEVLRELLDKVAPYFYRKGV